MEIQERIICRLCFKVCNSLKAIEEELKDAWHVVLKDIDLTIPMVCLCCADMLIKYSQFKTTCLNARDSILPFVNQGDDIKLNLKEVFLTMSENAVGLSEAQEICGFCMSPVKTSSATSFDVIEGDMLQNMIKQCLPELDFSIMEKPVICAPCRDTLESCFCFVTNCLVVEGKIKEYRETRDEKGKEEIALSGLLECTARDVTVKVKNEGADEEEVANGGDTLKVEQILFCDVKEDLEIKNESCTEPDDYCTPINMLAEGDIKVEKTFWKESELKEESFDVVDEFKEEIDIKTEGCDSNRFEDEVVLSQVEITTELHRKQKSLKPDVGGDVSLCSFQMKLKSRLKRHMLKHKDLSEVTLYKCDSCLYRTKYKAHLKGHLLTHKDPSEVTMYKCSLCSYQTKLKMRLKPHMLRHKDPSEVTMYQCSLCSFQTNLKGNLKRHMLKYKDLSEVTLYKCDSCLYQTKYKAHLKEHLLTHKDPSEVTMYKCSLCSFQTKFKMTLKPHMLRHKDPSEVKMYQCNLCSYQTKSKHTLKQHDMVKHKDPSEVTMYQCNICPFQTKHKISLKRHIIMVKHKYPIVSVEMERKP